MIRPCTRECLPDEEGRYLVFCRTVDRWEIAVWCGVKKGWRVDGIPVNPVCWCPLPAKVKEGGAK